MRKIFGWIIIGGLLAPVPLFAQYGEPSARRTLGAPATPAAPNNNFPVTDGSAIAAPPATTPGRGNFGGFVRPTATPMVPQEPAPTDNAVAAPPAGFGTSGIRPRTDSATRFSAGESTSTPAARTLSPRVASNATRVAAPPVTTPTEASSPMAEMLLGQALQLRAQNELPGQPLALAQVFERTASPAQRIKAVQTYWKLVAKVAAYHGAIDDKALVNGVNVRQMAQHDKATLAAAQMACEAAVRRAELEFITAQNELVDAALLADADAQPLPSDVPLVSEYRTQFNTLFGERAAPSGLRRLDRALPYHLKDVRSQADALMAAQQALQATAEAVSTGEATVTNLVEVQRMMARQRANFNNAVFEYNAIIAEYALHVAPGSPSRETLVGMLIKTSKPLNRSAAIQHEGDVRVVSGEEYIVKEELLPLSAATQPAEPRRSFQAADTAPQLVEPHPQPRVQGEGYPTTQPARFEYNDEPAPMEVQQPQPGEPNVFDR